MSDIRKAIMERLGAVAEGAKAVFAAPGIVVKEDAQYIYYYPDEDDRATFADDDGKGAYTVKSNRTGKPVSAKTYRSWDEAVQASNAINEKLPPLKKRKASMSRPGAKAKMEKWTVVMPSIPDAGTRHFDSWEQAKKYVDTKMGGFTALVSVDGKRYALKHALGQWEKYSRPGAKEKMAAHWTERVEVVEDVSYRNKNTGATASGGGAVPWRSASDRANWEEIPGYSLMDTRTGTTSGKKYRTRKEAERALADAKEQRVRDQRRAEREAASPDARRRAATIKEIDRLMSTGMTQIEAIEYLKSRGLRIASSRPGAKAKAEKPDDTEREDVKAGLKVMSAADPAVSDKIRTLIKEGKPQDQAVAIALDMKRRGEL